MKQVLLIAALLLAFFVHGEDQKSVPSNAFLYYHRGHEERMCKFYEIPQKELALVFPECNTLIENFNMITPIKSGTNLLCKTLSLMTRRGHAGLLGIKFQKDLDGKFLFKTNHFFSEEVLNNFINSPVKTLTIVRDPRDILISMCHWFHQIKDPAWVNATIQERAKLLLKTRHIVGEGCAIQNQLARQRDLMEGKEVLAIRFEELVGPKGGGSAQLQQEALLKIAKFIKTELSKLQLNYLRNRIFGTSYSFRKGQIGSWKCYFDEELRLLCKKELGHFIIDLGYEKDNDW